jgi:hypothetical protein
MRKLIAAIGAYLAPDALLDGLLHAAGHRPIRQL